MFKWEGLLLVMLALLHTGTAGMVLEHLEHHKEDKQLQTSAAPHEISAITINLLTLLEKF